MGQVLDEHLLDHLAEKVVRSRLTVPAVFLLELAKPVAFLGSQLIVLCGPVLHLLVDPDRCDRFADRVACRENWEALIRRIEERSRDG